MGRSPGRFGVIAVTSPDPVLSLLSALGLAQAAGSALVIDMCGDLTLASGRTLSDLAAGWAVRVRAQPRAVLAWRSCRPGQSSPSRPRL